MDDTTCGELSRQLARWRRRVPTPDLAANAVALLLLAAGSYAINAAQPPAVWPLIVGLVLVLAALAALVFGPRLGLGERPFLESVVELGVSIIRLEERQFTDVIHRGHLLAQLETAAGQMDRLRRDLRPRDRRTADRYRILSAEAAEAIRQRKDQVAFGRDRDRRNLIEHLAGQLVILLEGDIRGLERTAATGEVPSSSGIRHRLGFLAAAITTVVAPAAVLFVLNEGAAGASMVTTFGGLLAVALLARAGLTRLDNDAKSDTEVAA